MNSKQKKSLILIFSLLFTLISFNIERVSGNIDLIENSAWDWGVDLGTKIIYQVKQNYGMGWETSGVGFEVTSTGSLNLGPGYVDFINFSKLIYDSNTGNMITSNLNLTTAIHQNLLGEGFWQTHIEGELLIISPLIPINSTPNADFDAWAPVMANHWFSANTYGDMLQLDNYRIIGNEIQLFNDTTGFYCNMTYFPNNGTMESAKTYFNFTTESGPMTLYQEYTRIYNENIINPLDETSFSLPISNILYFRNITSQSGYNDESIFSQNIVSDTIHSGQNYMTLDYVREINGTKLIWDDIELEWETDPYGFVNKPIGVANDNKNFFLYDADFTYLWKLGSTSVDINATYYPVLSTYQGFDQSVLIDTYTTLFENSVTHDFVQIEINSDGTLKNITIYYDGPGMTMEISQISNNYEGFSNQTNNLEWGVNVGDALIYEFNKGYDNPYGKYVITKMEYKAVDDMAGGLAPAIMINATFYNYTNPGEWDMSSDHTGMMNYSIGCQNENQIFLPEGPNSLIFAIGTTGLNLNDSWALLFYHYVGFDQFQVGSNSWNCSNSTNENDFYDITWNNDGIVTNLRYNITDPMELARREIDMSLFSALPIASFTYTINNGSLIVTSSSSGGFTPLTYTWNFGDGASSVSGPSDSHIYTQNGTYTVILTVEDSFGLISTFSEEIEVVIILPKASEEPTGFNIDGYLLIPFLMLFSISIIGLIKKIRKIKCQ